MKRVAVVNALLEFDWSPVRIDQFGVQPVSQLSRVADGRRERDGLQRMVQRAEFRECDFQGRAALAVVDEVDLVGDDTGEVVEPRRIVSHE